MSLLEINRTNNENEWLPKCCIVPIMEYFIVLIISNRSPNKLFYKIQLSTTGIRRLIVVYDTFDILRNLFFGPIEFTLIHSKW